MEPTGHILIVDPDHLTGELLKDWFRNSGHRFTCVDDGHSALDMIASTSFDMVLAEFRLAGVGGFDLVRQITQNQPNLPVVMIAGKYDSRTAIELVKAGAFDFVPKPLDEAEVRRSLAEAIQSSQNSSAPVQIGTANDQGDTSGDSLVGNSRAMLGVYKALGRLSPTPVTVLIQGETGTGKELVARALYQYGHRSHKPFITVNCAAIPENLLESELFGHEKGAFTGAVTARVGKFEQAHNATLFLDEIGDMDLSLQSKLLRVLQEKRFHRVGGSEEISVDVRIIAATHRDLQGMVNEGTFREDLYYRLNVAQIELPPLRERNGDIPLLANYFLSRFCAESQLAETRFTASALERLETGAWPGNVRQLQNVVRKAALNARGYSVDEPNIRSLMEDQTTSSKNSNGDISQAINHILSEHSIDAHRAFLDKFEPLLLKAAMIEAKGNLSKAAEHLGLSRYTLREKLRHHQLRE